MHHPHPRRLSRTLPGYPSGFRRAARTTFVSFDQLIFEYEKHVAAYESALEASPLDPAELGRSAVAVLQVFRDYGDRRTAFINRRYADLSPVQQAKLKTVNDAVPNDQPNQGYYGNGLRSGFRYGYLDPPPF